MTDQELLRIATERVMELCRRHGIDVPTVTLDLRGTTAGTANGKTNSIRLNAVLFKENFQDFYDNTIPHELCHVWHHQMQKRGALRAGRSHGRDWQILMLRMGVRPRRAHNYDVARSRVRTLKRYQYACGCRAHELSAVRHSKIAAGKVYLCRHCKGPLSPAISAG